MGPGGGRKKKVPEKKLASGGRAGANFLSGDQFFYPGTIFLGFFFIKILIKTYKKYGKTYKKYGKSPGNFKNKKYVKIN